MSGESVFSDAGTVSSFLVSPSMKRRKRIIRTAVGVVLGLILIICLTTGVSVSRRRSRRKRNDSTTTTTTTIGEEDDEDLAVPASVPTNRPSVTLETLMNVDDYAGTPSPAAPQPSLAPSYKDASVITDVPTVKPSVTPVAMQTSRSPTTGSTDSPSGAPIMFPTSTPTLAPSSLGSLPSASPSETPSTVAPVESPATDSPTMAPTIAPTIAPTLAPTINDVPAGDSPATDNPTKGPVTAETTPPPTASATSSPTEAGFGFVADNLDVVFVVGGVTTSSAKIMVRTTQSSQVRILYGTTYGDLMTRGTITDTVKTKESDDYTVIITLNGLSSFLKYYYRIVVDDEIMHDPGYLQEFTTFPFPGGSYDEVTVALFADTANATRNLDAPAYRQMPESTILAMQIGDMDHSDPRTLTDSRLMHRSLLSPSLTNHGNDITQGVLSRMAFDHTWNDHDYCGQDTDKTCPSKSSAVQAYKEYFPTYALPSNDDAIYHKFEIGDAEFFVLDTRSQRDPDLDPDTEDKSVLGETQRQWLFDGLLASERTWKIVVSSVTANTSARPDNSDHWMTSFTNEAALIREFLQEHGLDDTTIMVSGDLHTGGGIDDGTNNGWGIVELAVAHTNLAAGNGADLGTWSVGITNGNNGNGGFATITISADTIWLRTRDAEGNPRQWYYISF